MTCFYPRPAWRVKSGRDPVSGKWPLTFNPREGYRDLEVCVPCGKCLGCRLDQSRQWAVRCVHESKMHEKNCVVTLTYAESLEHLIYEDVQKFLKLLRKKFGSFRYFGCGEYGEKKSRPHWHIILFGLDFPDKKLITVHLGNRQYDSEILRKIWKKGHISIGDVTFSSAAYIARYCFKKQIEKGGEEDYPERTFMSLKPGIGSTFADKYKNDFISAQSSIIGSQKYKIPKYYEKFIPDDKLEQIKASRQSFVENESDIRRFQKAEFLRSKLQSYKRSFESD